MKRSYTGNGINFCAAVTGELFITLSVSANKGNPLIKFPINGYKIEKMAS